MLGGLLANVPRPRFANTLRLVNASTKAWSRPMLSQLEPVDEDRDPCAMGFKQAQRRETSAALSAFTGPNPRMGGVLWTPQLDFAAAYDSTDHSRLCHAMVFCSVPREGELWCIRERCQQIAFGAWALVSGRDPCRARLETIIHLFVDVVLLVHTRSLANFLETERHGDTWTMAQPPERLAAMTAEL